jgi:hypothetical protein
MDKLHIKEQSKYAAEANRREIQRILELEESEKVRKNRMRMRWLTIKNGSVQPKSIIQFISDCEKDELIYLCYAILCKCENLEESFR